MMIDFGFKYLGYVKNDRNPRDWNIYVNPFNCHNGDELLQGHPEDCGFVSTIMHEFGHLLNYKLDLINKYQLTMFQKKNCHITHQAKENHDEELADLISLYIINPMCVKIIDEERFNWLKDQFQSPSRCSKRKFLSFYNTWRPSIQDKFCKKYNVQITPKNNIFVNNKKI